MVPAHVIPPVGGPKVALALTGFELAPGLRHGGQPRRLVVVGHDHDVAASAVSSIGRWWEIVGARRVPPGEHVQQMS
jgi:hypothetical protein